MSKMIPLTKGYVAFCDDADFGVVSQHKWHALEARGVVYAATNMVVDVVSKKRRKVLMHRLLASPSGLQKTDHRDGDGLNNTRANLRVCTHAQNMWNSKSKKCSFSGVRNVFFRVSKGLPRWIAVIHADGLTYTKTCVHLADAKAWAEQKRAVVHGEFAYDVLTDKRGGSGHV